MPFSVRVNMDRETITLVCWGDITVDDLMEYERRYWGGTEHEGWHHIIDLQLAELKISLDEGLMLATHATPVDLDAYAGARSALVVADEDQQFLAESYKDARHSMCAPKVREVGVFYDTEMAKSWIAESPVARAFMI